MQNTRKVAKTIVIVATVLVVLAGVIGLSVVLSRGNKTEVARYQMYYRPNTSNSDFLSYGYLSFFNDVEIQNAIDKNGKYEFELEILGAGKKEVSFELGKYSSNSTIESPDYNCVTVASEKGSNVAKFTITEGYASLSDNDMCLFIHVGEDIVRYYFSFGTWRQIVII